MSDRFSPRKIWSPGRGVLLVVIGWMIVSPAISRAQLSPEESARHLRPAKGLEAKLWAAEPLLVNPTNIDVDSRGRVWVTEGLNYRLARVANARFKRIEGSDKIKIVQDTDGDGIADRSTVFAEGIYPVPMGIAVEERWSLDGTYRGCRVFVGNSPDLLVLEDTDGDDKADRRYPLLTGFGGIDSDHGVHGMVLGLDGRLYFTQGDAGYGVPLKVPGQTMDVLDKGGRHVRSNQLGTALRVDRDGTNFEIIADRLRNDYEASLDSYGNLFISDNDDDGNRGSRVIWAMDGGRYGYKTPGSPRHWGEDVPGNVPKLVGTGNGSPAGIMVYEGDQLPEPFRGAIFEVDAGTRQINLFPIVRKGAAFRTEPGVFLSSDDPWFRPIDACTAPDGSVFVADWYDAGVGGHAFADQTTGRLLRVTSAAKSPGQTKPDFGSIGGLITALKSPNVATRDVARRGLIARAGESTQALEVLYREGTSNERARALHVLMAIGGVTFLAPALKDDDPRIRETAVRLLGRDCRENGMVAYDRPSGRREPPAMANLALLLPLAGDPDAGVRRELILALRKVPTQQAGDALRALTAAWDGQDRWYLEALGLALQDRESEYISRLFSGPLFGEIGDPNLPAEGPQLAVPPFFPVDRNEAYIPASAPDQASTPLSKSLGLAWRLRRNEVVPLLRRMAHRLKTPALQQAIDDVLGQIRSPDAAVLVARMIEEVRDPVRKRQLLTVLSANLEGQWRGSKDDASVEKVILDALKSPETRSQGIALVAASRDARYDDILESIARDEKAPEETRVAAVEALGAIHGPVIHFLDHVISSSAGKPHSTPISEAAVRTISGIYDTRTKLTELITDKQFPLGVRRESLRALASHRDGAQRVLDLARSGRLPDDLKTDAVTLLLTHRDGGIRDQVARVLPLPKSAGGGALPPVGELIRRSGNPEHGRAVFFRTTTNACAGCHRVQGRGQWVGPDLSTIGTKYGKEELLRSILNPSAAIGYNFRALVLALADGRLITGLPLEDSAQRLVVKTADGKRVSITPGDVEDRKSSDVSLMPDGLAQTMTDRELVDLIAFLSSLREPVSIVGQYHVLGPIEENGSSAAIDPASFHGTDSRPKGEGDRSPTWRRISADAEGLATLTSILENENHRAIYAYTPVVSRSEQKVRLVLDSRANMTAWLDGRIVINPGPGSKDDGPREVELTIPRGKSTLLIRLTGGAGPMSQAALVTTFISPQPVSFDVEGVDLSAR